MNEETTQAEETTDAFMDGWDGGTEESEPAEETETTEEPKDTTEPTEPQKPAELAEPAPGAATVEPAAEPGQTQPDTKPAETTAPAAETQEVPKTYVLRHLDEEKTVDETELVTLAQKGMDYDRIREKYNAAKPVIGLFAKFAKESNIPVEQYAAQIRVNAKQAEGMSIEEATRAVDMEDRELKLSEQEAEAQEARAEAQKSADRQNTAEQRRREDIAEFQKSFPEAAKTPDQIPPEVWEAVKGGQRLVTAYALFQVKAAQAEAETAKTSALASAQNQKNGTRSAGSMQSAGNTSKTADPFLDGWND